MFGIIKATYPFKNIKFRWTLNRKIGGLAAGLLLLMGGVSLYSYFEINEISRELEEIGQSDFPLYEITTKLIILQKDKQKLIENLDINSPKYIVIDKLNDIDQDINNLITEGIKKSQFAIHQELEKEDDIRLNQINENYGQLKTIFLQIKSINNNSSLYFKKIVEHNQNQDNSLLDSYFKQVEQSLQTTDDLTWNILDQLKLHIEGSVAATTSEKTLAVRNNALISFIALLFGISVSTILTRKITHSVNKITSSIDKVTQQAEFIAQNIDKENLICEALIVDTDDEIKDLSIAFNRLVINFLETQKARQKIAEQLLSEKKSAQWLANHDSLTGLVNRRKFESQLSEIWLNEPDKIHSLLYMDLDRFKIVNDTCGHYAGDELLKKVSKILGLHISKSATLARLGGDEFAIILPNYSSQESLIIAEKILSSINQFCFVWQTKNFSIGISIGLLSFQSPNDSLISVIRAADTACNVAKNRGRNQIYKMENKDLELKQKSQEMNWLETINEALDSDLFVLYHQKIKPLQSRFENEEHYEVLIRMKGQDNQIYNPMAFIPIAERYQLMNKIDRWVIRELFETQGNHYRQRGKAKYTDHNNIDSLYTINLSGESLNDASFVNFIQEQLELHQILPQLICFEITETVAVANLDQARQMISQLRAIGCRFALDDFGTGMSSYAYLKSLPVDFLKIDGAFIRELLDDPINSAIIKSFHQVAKEMGMLTVAEFVDSEEKLIHLKSLGIDYAQGYWIAKPEVLSESYCVAKT